MNIYSIIDTAITVAYIAAAAIIILGIITAKPATAPAPNPEPKPEPKPDPKPEPAPAPKAAKPTLANLIVEKVQSKKVEHQTVLDAFTIRELRSYVRENGLQEKIRFRTGKTVSKLTKSEILGAIS